MADDKTDDPNPADVAKGLNSPEIRENNDIPYADEAVELEYIQSDEPTRPARQKDVEAVGNGDVRSSPKSEPKRQIHASDIGDIHSVPGSDTIVVDTPEGTLYITLTDSDGKSSKSSPKISPSADEPSTSKAADELESKVMIENEIDEELRLRRTNLTRRNSISMPALPNLGQEVLLQQSMNQHQNVSLIFFFFFLSAYPFNASNHEIFEETAIV